MAEELGPVWRLRAHPLYHRARRFRHTRIGRVLTWPVRAPLRRLLRNG
jgi:hypothetical protein